jgi:hypothetical protein
LKKKLEKKRLQDHCKKTAQLLPHVGSQTQTGNTLANTLAMSCTTGTFSYQYSKSFFMFAFDETTAGRIVRVDSNIAKLYFEKRDADGKSSVVPIPDKMKMRDVAVHEDIEPYNGEFLFAFGGTYVLDFDDRTLLRLAPSRHQEVYVSFHNLPRTHSVETLHEQSPEWKVAVEAGECDEAGVCDAPAELSEVKLIRIASIVSIKFDESMETYTKALDLLKSYKIVDFIKTTIQEWPDKSALMTRMCDIMYKSKDRTVEEMVWAHYCMKLTDDKLFKR